MTLKSLDPRVSRWNIKETAEADIDKQPLDQLPTYEVFIQMKEGKAFEHAGIVHATDLDTAFVFAKEQFSRRYTCSGMWVTATDRVFVTAYTELEENIYDQIPEMAVEEGPLVAHEIFHLTKRGKQHKHAGQVKASGPQHALQAAKSQFDSGKPVLNIWVIKNSDLRISDEQEKIIWATLVEKIHRDVISYKAADKIKEYKERQQQHG